MGAARAHWQWIWQHINYVPIFQLGERVLEEVPITRVTLAAFQALLREAQAICAQQSALRHDLMGRIYHWLLHHAKYLGTYYTSVAAATLLLKLTLSRTWDRDFGHPAQLSELLFIARKKQHGQETLASTAYVNLWRNPSRLYEALDLAERLKTLTEGIISTASGSVGEVFHLPAATGVQNWQGVLFARSGPVKAFLALQQESCSGRGKRRSRLRCVQSANWAVWGLIGDVFMKRSICTTICRPCTRRSGIMKPARFGRFGNNRMPGYTPARRHASFHNSPI